jgi:hypothetical protein
MLMTPEVPDIYEHDLREVATILDSFKEALETHDGRVQDAFVLSMVITIESANNYPIGTLTYSDDQWRFTPYADWAQEK